MYKQFPSLAEAFLNSENELLQAAALDWTGDQELEIKQFAAGNSPVKWGKIDSATLNYTTQ